MRDPLQNYFCMSFRNEKRMSSTLHSHNSIIPSRYSWNPSVFPFVEASTSLKLRNLIKTFRYPLSLGFVLLYLTNDCDLLTRITFVSFKPPLDFSFILTNDYSLLTRITFVSFICFVVI